MYKRNCQVKHLYRRIYPHLLQEAPVLTTSQQRPYRGAIRALRFMSLGLLLALVVLAILSAYTIFKGFSVTMSGEENIFNMKQEVDPETGDWLFTLRGQPRNDGFLPITFGVKVRLLNLMNETVATGENSTQISPGGTGTFKVTVRAPKELVEQGRGAMEVELRLRTLMDLVGFSIRLRIQGGV